MNQSNHKMKVLFIAGASRSGSTILEKIINSIDGVVSLGEVSYLWERGFQYNWKCGCGENFDRCDFWQTIKQKAFENDHPVDFSHVNDLSKGTERFRYLPYYLMGNKRPDFQQKVREYATYIEKIYNASSQNFDAKLLVDSSKHMHGFILKHIDTIDLHILHLVRDSRATTYSWTRKKIYQESHDGTVELPRFSPFVSSFHWIFDNLSGELIKRYNPKYMRLRYEDFTRNPKQTIQKIINFVELPSLTNPFEEDNRSVQLNTQHSVSGNPVRFKNGKISIKTDEQWKRDMPWLSKISVSLLTLPLLIRYGYLTRKSSADLRSQEQHPQ